MELWQHISVPCYDEGYSLHAWVRAEYWQDAVDRLRRDDPIWREPTVHVHWSDSFNSDKYRCRPHKSLIFRMIKG